MSARCSPLCGWCGACTAAWEREDDERDEEHETDQVIREMSRNDDEPPTGGDR